MHPIILATSSCLAETGISIDEPEAQCGLGAPNLLLGWFCNEVALADVHDPRTRGGKCKVPGE
jgi:hypothetical protein